MTRTTKREMIDAWIERAPNPANRANRVQLGKKMARWPVEEVKFVTSSQE